MIRVIIQPVREEACGPSFAIVSSIHLFPAPERSFSQTLSQQQPTHYTSVQQTVTLTSPERTAITTNPYTTDDTMSRRALMSVPRAISASVRPSLASHTASPFLRPAIIQPSQKRSYHEKVLDHYSNPRNVGSMDKNAGDVGTGTSKSQIILCPSSAPRNARSFGHRMS